MCALPCLTRAPEPAVTLPGLRENHASVSGSQGAPGPHKHTTSPPDDRSSEPSIRAEPPVHAAAPDVPRATSRAACSGTFQAPPAGPDASPRCCGSSSTPRGPSRYRHASRTARQRSLRGGSSCTSQTCIHAPRTHLRARRRALRMSVFRIDRVPLIERHLRTASTTSSSSKPSSAPRIWTRVRSC